MACHGRGMSSLGRRVTVKRRQKDRTDRAALANALLIPRDARALRQNNLDAIRLTMALLVVWSHSFALWKGTEDGEPISRLMSGTYNAGNVAVLAFFAISGFLITLSWERSASWRQYLRRRVMRIHPGYLVAITLCSLIVVPAVSSRPFGMVRLAELGGMLSNILLQNYIVPGAGEITINGSLWSIPYEFWCYIGVMALGLARLRGRWIYPALATLLIVIRIWLDMTGRRPSGGMLSPIIGYAYFWFNVAPPFLLGGAAYRNRDRIPRSPLLLAALVLLTIATAHLPVADPLRTVLTRTLFPWTLVYAVLYLAFSRRIRMADAARFGDFSYGSYLYAFPIQRLLEHYGRGALSFPAYVLSSLILTLLAGILSWLCVERWFLPRVRRGTRHAADRSPLEEEITIVAP